MEIRSHSNIPGYYVIYRGGVPVGYVYKSPTNKLGVGYYGLNREELGILHEFVVKLYR